MKVKSLFVLILFLITGNLLAQSVENYIWPFTVGPTSKGVQVTKVKITAGSSALSINSLTLTYNTSGINLSDFDSVSIYRSDVSGSRLLATKTGLSGGDGTTIGYNVNIQVDANKSTYLYIVVSLKAPVNTTGTFRFNVTQTNPPVAITQDNDNITVSSTYFAFLSAEALDENSDGKVEKIRIRMNDQINDATLVPSSFTVKRRTQADETESTINVSSVSTGATANDNIFEIILANPAPKSTGDYYEVNFDGSTPTIRNLSGTLTAQTQFLATVDKALPVIVRVTTKDNDSNGKLDALDFEFSENVVIGDSSAADGMDNLVVTNVVINNSDYSSTGFVTVKSFALNEVGYNTGVTPAVTYSRAGKSTILDREGQEIRDGLSVTSVDEAKPRLVKIWTLDTNKDGKLDKFAAIFSEPIRIPATDTVGGKNDTIRVFKINSSTGAGNYSVRYEKNQYGGFIRLATAPLTLGDSILVDIIGPGYYDTGISFNVAFDTSQALSNRQNTYYTILDAAGNIADAISSITTTDGAEPVLLSAVTQDTDGNGKIDRFLLTFSEKLDTTGITSLLSSGMTFTTQLPFRSGQTYNIKTVYPAVDLIQAPNDQHILKVTVEKLGGQDVPFNTADRPVFSYTPGNLKDAAGNKTSAITGFVLSDNAAPVLYWAVFYDDDKNGKFDKVLLRFTEDIYNPSITELNNLDGVRVNAKVKVFSYNSQISVVPGSFVEQYNAQTLTSDIWVNLDTSDLDIPLGTDPVAQGMRVEYVQDGTTSDLVDANNQAIVVSTTLSGGAIKDAAKPLVHKAETMDLNKNGKIDHYKIYFTEKVKDSSFDGFTTDSTIGNVVSNWVVKGYTGVRFDPTVSGDVKNDSIIYIAFNESGAFDTDKKPDVLLSNSTLVDLADTTDFSPSFADSIKTGVEELDRANPVLYQAIGQVNSKNLRIWFSEPVVSGVAPTQFIYDNEGTGNDRAKNVVGVTGSGAVYTLTTDDTLTVDDVERDSLGVLPSNTIKDAANNIAINFGGATKISIDDRIPPTVTKIEFYDRNNNGKLDSMVVYFSEDINLLSVDGNLGLGKRGNPVTTWVVSGRSNVRASLFGFPSVSSDRVPFVFDEIPGDEGDTGEMPDVTVTGSTIADFKPNYLVNVTSADIVETDKAGPAIMNTPLTKIVAPNVVEVRFSEPVKSATFSGADLEFQIASTGRFLDNYQMTSVKLLDGGRTARVFFDNNYFVSSASGEYKVKFSGAGVVTDAAGNGNTQTGLQNLTYAVTVASPSGSVTALPAQIQGAILEAKFKRSSNDPFSSEYKEGYIQVTRYEIYRRLAGDAGAPLYPVFSFVPPSKNTVSGDTIAVRFVPIPLDTLVYDYFIVAVAGDKASGREAEPLKIENINNYIVANLSLKGEGALPGIESVSSGLVYLGSAKLPADLTPPAAPGKFIVVDDPADNGLGLIARFELSPDDGKFIEFTTWAGTQRIPLVSGYNIYDGTGKLIATIPAGVKEYRFNALNRELNTYVIRATDGGNDSEPSAPNKAIAVDNSVVGDFNSDRRVDVFDLVIFSKFYGLGSSDGEYDVVFDLNRDGQINIYDLVEFSKVFGTSVSSKVNVPEKLGYLKGDIKIDTETLEGERVSAILKLTGVSNLKGYQFNIKIENGEIERVDGGKEFGLFVEKASASGRLVAGVSLAEVSSEPELVSLVIKVKDPSEPARIEINDIVVITNNDEAGLLNNVSYEANIIPKKFALMQNYPNPFNPSTTIRFDIPKEARVKVVIYDIMGRQVRTLVDEDLKPGVYKITWDGRNDNGEILSSGIYFYRIVADKFVDVKKMVLLK